MINACYINDIEYTLDYGIWYRKVNNKFEESEFNPLLVNASYDINTNNMDPLIKLSSKELEQFNHHLNARTYNDIAQIMDVSLPTVKKRAAVIIEKYNYIAKTIHELVVIYYKHQITLLQIEK